ncbi:hypothetical protein SARC_00167 [Sphaeroforma arctica JP610]|uniref:PDZ domain-containing protein n=1 Tax=Sphaeroforma arctica JP610 TaxID=667725 RepID=A0A0L0GHC0_9EUKA|nr:hypothetical protein SARC_00167 [Sphaeroforma arctica JP610]KNC87733.1 hypothetical protein SARC_00167 [Sphaeroforma arctica JP610]|eukprot:XP_014161635.1 hypothetical protein SARC_00167 [Sphaeroforma arctica JP610]
MRSVDASHAITHNDSVRLTVRKPLTLVLQREEVDVSWGFGIRNGVISSEIEPDSPAALANLPPDHAILSVNGNEVICLSDEELKKVLQKAGHELRVKLRHVTVYRELLRSVGLSLKSSSKRMYGMFPVNTEKKEIVSKFEKILDPRPKGIKDDRNFRVLKEGYIVKELESAESSSEE